MINPELLNAYAHYAKHVLSFTTLRNWRDPSDPLRSLIIFYYLYLGQCHLLYLYSLQKVIHRRNRETTRWPIPRTPSRRREIRDDKNTSRPVARHLNLPNHSKQPMAVCGLSLRQGSTESRKTLEQKFIFQISFINPHGINERFSFN